MDRKREAIFMGIGILVGLALSGSAAQAADYLTARPTTQTFYINGQQASLTAYLIGGSNYVRLRDIGRTVDFGVSYDAATNTVYPIMSTVTSSLSSSRKPILKTV